MYGFVLLLFGVLGLLVAVIGQVVLVAPVRHRPRCCTSARFTTWFAAAGTAVVPVVGTAVGAALGFLVGHVVWAAMGAERD